MLIALLATPTIADAASDKPRMTTLTVIADYSAMEFNAPDVAPAGFSQGDPYVAAVPVKDERGRVVGTQDLVCTVTEADDGNGPIRQVCDSVTSLGRRGQIVSTGVWPMVRDPNSTSFPPVLPTPRFSVPIVGGTGAFLGASGELIHTFPDGKMRFRYRR